MGSFCEKYVLKQQTNQPERKNFCMWSTKTVSCAHYTIYLALFMLCKKAKEILLLVYIFLLL
jgi:hypothetical protein